VLDAICFEAEPEAATDKPRQIIFARDIASARTAAYPQIFSVPIECG
jgi:hypothetical protein